MQYIKIEFGEEISLSSYWRRRGRLQSDTHTQHWLNQFTKIGFVQHHRKQIDDLEKVQADRLRQFFIETKRNPRDERKISQLNYDIRENARLLSELGLGTPIISAIKAKIEQREKKENAEAIQVST